MIIICCLLLLPPQKKKTEKEVKESLINRYKKKVNEKICEQIIKCSMRRRLSQSHKQF